MAKKFIEFIEAAAIIVLTAVLVVGVINYLGTTEPKDETPVGDTLPGDEPVISTLTITGNEYFSLDDFTITYEDGMTWEEWVNSEYNEFGFVIMSDYVGYEGLIIYATDGSSECKDLISDSLSYYLDN